MMKLSIKLLRFVITCNNGKICIRLNTLPLSSLQNHVFPLVWGFICQPLVFFHFFCCHFFSLLTLKLKDLLELLTFLFSSIAKFMPSLHVLLHAYYILLKTIKPHFHLKDISNNQPLNNGPCGYYNCYSMRDFIFIIMFH